MNTVEWVFICFFVAIIAGVYGHKHGVKCMLGIMKTHLKYNNFSLEEAIEYEEKVESGE
jgi:hypothetical protein